MYYEPGKGVRNTCSCNSWLLKLLHALTLYKSLFAIHRAMLCRGWYCIWQVVCPSVRPSVCDAEVSWSYRLEFL